MLVNPTVTALAIDLGLQLQRLQATVTTAESCTGGAIGAAITAVNGSSSWFNTGFITYSNHAKAERLGVPVALLDAYGAVSEPVVLAMVKGALQVTEADYGIAVSGIAGPSGGSEHKPTGTVCIAWGAVDSMRAATYSFKGDRDAVREQTVVAALSALQEELKKTV